MKNAGKGSPKGAKTKANANAKGAPTGSKTGKKPVPRPQAKVSAPASTEPAPRKKEVRVAVAEFVAGAGIESQLPAPTLAEVAFAGRSNVGKSSLLNTLLERRNLVRTSRTPGCTRQINLFHAKLSDGFELHMADLPGYGFAKVSKAEGKAWQAMIERYLAERSTLRAVVLLMDVRRALEDDDAELLEFLRTRARPAPQLPVEVLIVATKLDRLSLSERKPALAKFAKAAGRKAIGFSAVTGQGKDELWTALRHIVAPSSNAQDGARP